VGVFIIVHSTFPHLSDGEKFVNRSCLPSYDEEASMKCRVFH